MTNPFEDTEARYHVLINETGQHSLWPAFVAVPEGWTTALADAARDEAMVWIESNWDDPTTLGVAVRAS